MKFTIFLDDFTEELFYKMEKISESREGHKYEVNSET